MSIHNDYNSVFSLENIFWAWFKFRKGKLKKTSVAIFERHLEDNLFELYQEFSRENYKHGAYNRFVFNDGKKRTINAAGVRDRVVHQIIFDYLLKIFQPIFIVDTYSSLPRRGHHQAVRRLGHFIAKLLAEERGKCFVLKCDIKKYFENVDHDILKTLVARKIKDKKIFGVIKEIIKSFDKGIPLGNLTSQIFANIYLHELDIFVCKDLGVCQYVRYNDDFVIIGSDFRLLRLYKKRIQKFALGKLALNIPDNKVSIRKARWGVDFLGYIVLPGCVLLRHATKRKMLKRINHKNAGSYFGLVSHCDSYFLKQKMRVILAKQWRRAMKNLGGI